MTLTGLFVFIVVMICTFAICNAKQNNEKEDAAYRSTHIRTAESYWDASRDMQYLTKHQFAKRLDNGYYCTPIEDTIKDKHGTPHRKSDFFSNKLMEYPDVIKELMKLYSYSDASNYLRQAKEKYIFENDVLMIVYGEVDGKEQYTVGLK